MFVFLRLCHLVNSMMFWQNLSTSSLHKSLRIANWSNSIWLRPSLVSHLLQKPSDVSAKQNKAQENDQVIMRFPWNISPEITSSMARSGNSLWKHQTGITAWKIEKLEYPQEELKWFQISNTTKPQTNLFPSSCPALLI